MIFVVYLATIYDSKLLVGLADSIAYVPTLLSLWLGFLADKTRRKTRWLIGLTMLQGLIFLSVAQLIDIKLYQVVLLVAVLNIVSDTISNYLSMLTMPFFKSNAPDKDLESTNALYQVVGLTVVLASQPIGVWLLEVTGNDFSSLALLNALAFFASGFIYWRMRTTLTHQVTFTEAQSTVREQLTKMYATTTQVFQNVKGASFLTMIVLILLGNVLSVSFVTLMNMQFLDNPVLDFSYAQSVTLLGVSQIIGDFCGSLTINKLFKQLGLIRNIFFSALTMVLIGCFGLLRLDSAMMLLTAFALAFLGARFSPVFNAMLMRHVPDEQLGQVYAFISFMVTIAIPLGSVAFSFLGAYKPALAWGLFLVLAALRLIMT